MIRENLERLWERIERSCGLAGRKREEIQLVAVTKLVSLDKIAEAVRCGITDIGESRVQESQDKIQTLRLEFPLLRWHIIGHLQRNKVNRAIEIFDLVQSVDSLKLVEVVNQRASKIEKVQDCLVEVKVSSEPNKSGLPPEELENFLEFCQNLKNVRIKGLMTIAPYFKEPNESRPYFARARRLFERFFSPVALRSFLNNCQPILSMGMSSDFETAIEEGSNMVRIGSAIFNPSSELSQSFVNRLMDLS